MQLIKFHPGLISDIKTGKKRLTLRYDFSPKIRPGDGLKLVDASNNQIFGNAICTNLYTMTVKEIINTNFKYHNNYEDLGEFNKQFNHFYGREFSYSDELTVIEWGDAFHTNPYYG